MRKDDNKDSTQLIAITNKPSRTCTIKRDLSERRLDRLLQKKIQRMELKCAQLLRQHSQLLQKRQSLLTRKLVVQQNRCTSMKSPPGNC